MAVPSVVATLGGCRSPRPWAINSFAVAMPSSCRPCIQSALALVINMVLFGEIWNLRVTIKSMSDVWTRSPTPAMAITASYSPR